ncbi:MAG: acyl-CoA/acyl-ACP dehydrogenase [Deltaproteobacteria bacterium]|nr:acyl-CoA/acyl-ACP dehydrogenase [Deltaproteobacteria bacterium]
MPHPYRPSASALSLVERLAPVLELIGAQAESVDRDSRFPAEGMTALGAAGLLGLCIPTSHGGLGEGPRTFATVVEAISARCASTAMIFVMHTAAAQVVVSSATLADRDAILREMAAGRHLTTLAFSEAGSRSQFWAPVSAMSDLGGGAVETSAKKTWVTSASQANSYVSSGQMPNAESPLQSTLYLVRKGAAGSKVQGRFDGLGLRGNDSAPVTLEGLAVGAGDLLTVQGEGAGAMLGVVLPWFCVGTAAMAHGLCNAAVGATIGHLQGAGFAHTGTQLRDLPNLRVRVADMSVTTEQSRAMLGYTLDWMEDPSEATPLFVLESRLSALQAVDKVTDLAMKACGGAAFSKHLPIERWFRDARAGWVMAPTTDHLQEFVGRALTGLPLF